MKWNSISVKNEKGKIIANIDPTKVQSVTSDTERIIFVMEEDLITIERKDIYYTDWWILHKTVHTLWDL